MSPLDVARPDGAGKSVARVVGDRNRLLLVVEFDHRCDPAEDLLLRDAHAVVDAVEDRRPEEVAAGGVTGERRGLADDAENAALRCERAA